MERRGPERRPCKIIYCFPDGTQEEFISALRSSRSGSPVPFTEMRVTDRHDITGTPRLHSVANPDGQQSTPSFSQAKEVTAEIEESPESRNINDNEPTGGDRAGSGSILKSGQPMLVGRTCRCSHTDCFTLTEAPRHCCCDLCRPERWHEIDAVTNPRIGSVAPVTLFAFGMTTCLYNVHNAGICPLNLTTMGLVAFFGGLAQFIGGFFELINNNTLFCTLDVSYGSFWMATALTTLVPRTTMVTDEAPAGYMGGFFCLWALFSTTMFFSSFKLSYVQMLLMLLVMINFILNSVAWFCHFDSLKKIAGYEGIAEGALAVYVGMAFNLRNTYGCSILPLLFQKNGKIVGW